THTCIPALDRSAAGDVVNVSSVAGRQLPDVSGGVYSATKAAVDRISELLARELGPSGIRVFNLAPARVESELRDDIPVGVLRSRERGRPAVNGLTVASVVDLMMHMIELPRELHVRDLSVSAATQLAD